jgi:hypothetical protein
MGHKRPFASVEPHASFTLTSRHSPRRSVVESGQSRVCWKSRKRHRRLKGGDAALYLPGPFAGYVTLVEAIGRSAASLDGRGTAHRLRADESL